MGIHTAYNVSQTINNVNALEEEIEHLEQEIVAYVADIKALNQELDDWREATSYDSPAEYKRMKRNRHD